MLSAAACAWQDERRSGEVPGLPKRSAPEGLTRSMISRPTLLNAGVRLSAVVSAEHQTGCCAEQSQSIPVQEAPRTHSALVQRLWDYAVAKEHNTGQSIGSSFEAKCQMPHSTMPAMQPVFDSAHHLAPQCCQPAAAATCVACCLGRLSAPLRAPSSRTTAAGSPSLSSRSQRSSMRTCRQHQSCLWSRLPPHGGQCCMTPAALHHVRDDSDWFTVLPMSRIPAVACKS